MTTPFSSQPTSSQSLQVCSSADVFPTWFPASSSAFSILSVSFWMRSMFCVPRPLSGSSLGGNSTLRGFVRIFLRWKRNIWKKYMKHYGRHVEDIQILNSQNRNANLFQRQNLWFGKPVHFTESHSWPCWIHNVCCVSPSPMPFSISYSFSCSFAFSLVTLQKFILHPLLSNFNIFILVDLFYLFSVSLNNFHSFES